MFSSKIAPFTISYANTEEFHVLKQEIFTKDVYYFESENPQPIIIDAGAHIGITTLYFKKLFPAAHITAIEANPLLMPLLRQNLEQNGLQDVDVVPLALSDHSGLANFYIDESKDNWWSTGSFEQGAWNHQQQSRMIQVEAQPLADFITGPVDFLKMDIEGSELAVLNAAQAKLPLVKHLILEFHPVAGQKLADLVELLQQQRFGVQIWQDGHEIKEAKRAKGLVYVEAINKRK